MKGTASRTSGLTHARIVTLPDLPGYGFVPFWQEVPNRRAGYNRRMRALLAPYDKTGLIEFARGLTGMGWSLLATGNTERILREAGLPVTSVAEVIGFPEILDGRVKTLHPAIHGGLLARRDKPEHMQELAQHGIEAIDLVVNNLYPFEATIGKDGVTEEEAIENIDIGGPAMLRAAAKNFQAVVVLCDPADYDQTLASLQAGGVSEEQRRALAAKAFQHVALYDTLVSRYLRGDDDKLSYPDELTIGLRKREDLDLRYGENPHQSGALYLEAGRKAAGHLRLRAAAWHPDVVQQRARRRRRVADRH